MSKKSGINIRLEDTVITEEMKPHINEDDYKYYYIPRDVKPPKIAYFYEPDYDTKIFLGGTKNQERLIFPPNEEWEEYEEEQFEKFNVSLFCFVL
jgi:hypothetical protein